MTTEIVLMWLAVTAYAAGAVLYAVGFVFRKERITAAAMWVSLGGLLPHIAGIAVRWARLGHGPYLGFYEVVSSYALMTVIVFGLVALRFKNLRSVGVILMPLAFLALGGAMLAPKSDLGITGTLSSWWLAIHVAFAKLSYGSFIAALGLGAVFLLRSSAKAERWSERLTRLPEQDKVDDLTFKFVAVGFIFLGIMIAAGAIWANEAWGRYWSWDPIETWSLISWLVYAIVLHLRLTMGWRGRRFAWAAIAAFPVMAFAAVGVVIVYNSIHGAYLIGY